MVAQRHTMTNRLELRLEGAPLRARFQLSQLLEIFQDQIADFPEDPAASRGRHARPGPLMKFSALLRSFDAFDKDLSQGDATSGHSQGHVQCAGMRPVVKQRHRHRAGVTHGLLGHRLGSVVVLFAKD
jgi:hypothetical protein